MTDADCGRGPRSPVAFPGVPGTLEVWAQLLRNSESLLVLVLGPLQATLQDGGRRALQGKDSHSSPSKCLGLVRGHSRAPRGDKGNQGYRDGQLSILGGALATRTLHVST